MPVPHTPDVESFSHLGDVDHEIDAPSCQGLACFVARRRDARRWEATAATEPRVYCLGRCYASPASAASPPTRPHVRSAASHTVVLERIETGGARSLETYRRGHGFAGLERALTMSRASVVEEIETSALRGRGGAGFSAGRKWRSVFEASRDQKYVVCNADEGDPGAYIDRVLLEDDPYSVLEAMVIAGYAVGAERGFAYVRREYPDAHASIERAAFSAREHGLLGPHALGRGRAFDVEVVRGRGSYVCGEETALLNAIEGRRPEVRSRPPFPAVRGLFGCPTLVHNVETLANVSWILREGGGAYGALGRGASRGTKVLSLNSLFRKPGLYEVDLGVSLSDVVFDVAGGLQTGELAGVLVGGPLAGVIPPHLVDVPVTFEDLDAIGGALGHGGVVAFDRETTLAELAHQVFRFGAYESCGKCTPCRVGQRGSRGVADNSRCGQGARRVGARGVRGHPAGARGDEPLRPWHGAGRVRGEPGPPLSGRGGGVVRVTIDGTRYDVDSGTSILSAAHGVGIDLPAVCNDPRIAPSGACRVCIVHVDGDRSRPVTVCTTPVAEGMTITTGTPELEDLRRELVGMLARACPGAALAIGRDTPFGRILHRYDIAPPLGTARRARVDASHPYITVDMDRCILCFRCVRICAELQGQFTWRVWGRGAATRIAPDSGTTLLESSCVSCGACVDTCPTDALRDRSVIEHGSPERWTRTVCPYCGVGCELEVGTRGGTLVSARPVLDAPVSKGHLCVKGRYAHGFVRAHDRVRSPMIRRGRQWEAVAWDTAIEHVARGFDRVLDREGASATAVLGSARVPNEDNYLTQKFARVVLGTNNVDCCARVCHAPSAAAMGAMLGTGAATSSFDDIERAQTILVCGSNTTENHPIVGARIKQAVLAGARLVVVDPRAIELVEYADVHLQVRPGTNVLLLHALAQVIIEENLVDVAFVADRVDGFDGFRAFVAEFTPESVAAICGVEPDEIRRVARLYGGVRPAISFHGLGMTEHRHGTDMVSCLVNLALLTGNLGRPGAGVNPLRGQNNVQGAAHMGCQPDRLTGFVPLEEGREAFEAVWKASVPSAPGLDAMQLVQAAAGEAVKALWVIGWDILLTNPDTNSTLDALRHLDLVVVQDLFLNETAREVGTVFLPACSTFERDGTFMNSERRVQRVRAVVDPVGESKPDWEILCLAAHAMGHGDKFRYSSVQDVWDEIRGVWPAGAGISYERLDRERGLQWPCRDSRDPGTEILHVDSFPRVGRRARLRPVPYAEPGDLTAEHFPFVLVTGRRLYQFNAGTMTARTANVFLRPTDTLEISVEDARLLGIADGDEVRVRSRYGAVDLPAEVTDTVGQGVVFATFSDPVRRVNLVTGPYQDTRTRTPEYKVTAVNVERVASA